jgi:hypothetical protein
MVMLSSNVNEVFHKDDVAELAAFFVRFSMLQLRKSDEHGQITMGESIMVNIQKVLLY